MPEYMGPLKNMPHLYCDTTITQLTLDDHPDKNVTGSYKDKVISQ